MDANRDPVEVDGLTLNKQYDCLVKGSASERNARTVKSVLLVS
jgi:hypothetical protein